jgi:hypothetical protein
LLSTFGATLRTAVALASQAGDNDKSGHSGGR